MPIPRKIIAFGDSITKSWAPLLERALRRRCPEVEVLNRGVVSDTTRSALERLDGVLAEEPDLLLVSFGMNDWRKGVGSREFEENLCALSQRIAAAGIPAMFSTITPDAHFDDRVSREIPAYNEQIVAVARRFRNRVIDLYGAMQEALPKPAHGLYDAMHPDEVGNEILVDEIADIVRLDRTVIVWTFNGEHSFCNYGCKYCYVTAETNSGHYYTGDPERWHAALLDNFPNEDLTFYFSFGEPTAGRGFYEVLGLLGRQPRWRGHMTSNLSLPLRRLLEARVVQEGRFDINASFHPSQTRIEPFLEQLLTLRRHGIEASVIYVMWPPQMHEFERHFRAFDEHGFFVHVRRFGGFFQGKLYPDAYTSAEQAFTRQYCDRLTADYMLESTSEGDVRNIAKPSHAGMRYLMLDEQGDFWRSPDHKGDAPLWNLFAGDFAPRHRYEPFGAKLLGSVNIVASLKETGMDPLHGNFTWAFARQGGVFRDERGRVHYPFLDREVAFFGGPRPQVASSSSLVGAHGRV